MKLLPLALLAALAIAGCSQRPLVETQLKAIRTYGWKASVVDPAPDWNPSSHILVARALGGFTLLEEGGRGERMFATEDRRESHHPRWLNRDQFVFGPARNATRTVEGTVIEPSDGLTVVTVGEGRPQRVRLSDRGFRPRPAHDGLVAAQAGNRILMIDSRGVTSDFGEGFDIEPQATGPGLCWRDIPAFEPDWWTGRNGPGSMHVRWRPGVVDLVPSGVQAVWTRRDGVVVTVKDAEAPAGKAWWTGGTHLVHLPAPGAQPVTLRQGARDPAPHPLADLLAWSGDDGGVWIGTLRADGWQERIADNGSMPRWSHDGLRLCWLETPADGTQIPAIRVTVLAPR
jgi:hypothetical protein